MELTQSAFNLLLDMTALRDEIAEEFQTQEEVEECQLFLSTGHRFVFVLTQGRGLLPPFCTFSWGEQAGCGFLF